MQRYFVEQFDLESKKTSIINQDFHHLKNVMRMKKGDTIIVCHEGICFYGEIISFESEKAIITLTEKLETKKRNLRIDIAQALIRRERFEYMLQKSTELGVNTILPVKMKHNVVKFDEKKAKGKMERWNTITKEASEQAHRSDIAVVSDITTLKAIKYDKYDQVLVCYEVKKGSKVLREVLQKKVESILVVIGPEGGLDKMEIDFLQGIDNVTLVGLGPRILRSETASSYILSVLSYEYEMSE